MSKDFFWSLTVDDIKHAGWNSLNQIVIYFAGAIAAALTHNIATQAFGSREQGDKPKPTLLTRVLAIAGGLAATYFLSKRLEYTTFAAEKALKFLAINLVMTGGSGALFGEKAAGIVLIGAGGAGGYFGPYTLYALGTFGALRGSTIELKNRQR